MYDLEITNDSCIFSNSYIGLESRLDGQFGIKAVHTRRLEGMHNYSSFLKVKIKELNYILEVLRHNYDNKDFQIRVFEKDNLIVGRHYLIKEDRSLTNIFINVLEDIDKQLNKINKSGLDSKYMIYIIESIFKEKWYNG